MTQELVIALTLKEPWTCPRCGDVVNIAGRRTLHSLLPGVCRHAVLDHSMREDFLEHAGEGWSKMYVDGPVLAASFPVVNGKLHRPSNWRWENLKSRLRSRLTDEIKGHRRFWWWRYTAEYKARVKEFDASVMEAELDDEFFTGSKLEDPAIEAGVLAFERHKDTIAEREQASRDAQDLG